MNSNELLNNHYFIRNKKALLFIGIWPYQTGIYKTFMRICFTVSLYSMIIPQQIRTVYECQKDNMDITVIYENMTGFMYLQGCIVKYLSYIFFADKLNTVFEEITIDHQEVKDIELQKLQQVARIGRLSSVIYMCYGYIGGPIFWSINVVIPLGFNLLFPINESRPIALCYYAEYYVDQEEYFSILFFHTFITVGCSILVWTTVDSMYVNCVLHAVGLHRILRYRVSAIDEKFAVNTKKNFDENAAELQKYIIDSIKLHIKTIKFVDLIQESHDKCFMYTFTMFICGWAITIVDLIHSLNNIPNLIRILLMVIGIIFHLFYLTLPSQILIDESEQLRNAIYFTDWYRLPRQAKILLNFMMLRCSKPCQMTAGPLMILNMEYCGMIIKISLSYFTMALSFT